MPYPTDRYRGRPASRPWVDYRSNVRWGLPSAAATLVLIGVFQRLMPDQRWLPYLLAPVTVVLVLVPLRRRADRRAHRREAADRGQ